MEESRQMEEGDGEQQVPAEQSEEQTEEERATEQWLRRIPDDPSGLLKRKFRYQYQRAYGGQSEQQGW